MDRFPVLPGRSLASDLVRAETIESALQSRLIGRADAVLGTSWRLIYIRRGSVEVLAPEGARTITGPAAAWLPWNDTLRLRLAAGTVGVHVLAGQAIVTNAIGYKSESADIRMAADHPMRLDLAGDPRVHETVAQSVTGILREVQENPVSSMTVIEALLRILLITLWRGQGAPAARSDAGPSSLRIMSRFNMLVEAHFRERWSVLAFAERLGISADRLTDTCKRARGQTPKQVIDTRTAREARLLLETSTHTIDEIAGLLGFTSAANFNRFFKKVTGVPPGRYRKRPATAADGGPPLHEWP